MFIVAGTLFLLYCTQQYANQSRARFYLLAVAERFGNKEKKEEEKTKRYVKAVCVTLKNKTYSTVC